MNPATLTPFLIPSPTISAFQLGPLTIRFYALKIWDGGLGIWGAIALGLVGAYIGCRRHHVPFATLIDAAAPGLLIAQGLGRWGNWFNNELYGDPTTVPWKLQIHQMDFATGHALTDSAGAPVVLGYFQPTFLYESLWCLAAAALLLLFDRKYRLGAGSVFALYAVLYTAGRFVFELLRSDYANTILGLRVNTWVSGLLLLAGAAAFLALRSRDRSHVRPGPNDAQPPASSMKGSAE
ncbi:prolipoprotein diacylglyceryl transferase family protein [Specibacter cremeus]|uniref:prolipoprotein diacylglyceryl transferase family protein n=1 Tax=Specibacter cremeus TaxID=1629051 RepID=UPI000F77F507|nr:prolipoprotein diacylglyceryl transferase family protein [Specibacter cremeus]